MAVSIELLTAHAAPHRLPSEGDDGREQRHWVVRLARRLAGEGNAEELSARLSQEAAAAVVEARTARGLPVENVGHHVPIVQVLNVDELHVVISVETIRLEEDDAHAYLVAASAALRCLDEAAPIDDIQGIPRRFWRMMIGDLDAKHQP